MPRSTGGEMKEELLLSIDAGSGGGRAVVFNAQGELKARAYRAWTSYIPEGQEFMVQEFNPEHYWKLLCECTREVLGKVDKKQIRAVSSTSMRQGCLFFDQDGKCLYAGPNRDVRGITYAVEVEEALNRERCYELTCRWPPWMFVPCRLRWFQEEQHETFERVRHVLMINDWILYMLSGEMVAEPTNACETMLYDLNKKEWSAELIERIGLKPEALPRIARTGEAVGKVSQKGEQDTGIPQGTLVVAGGADTQAALVACRQSQPHQLGLVAGTTLPVMMTLDKLILDQDFKLWTHCHMFDGLYLLESQGGDAGKIFRGYVEGHFGYGQTDNDQKYETLIKLAEKIPPGSGGVRTFLGSLVWDLTKVNPNKPAAVLLPFPPDETNAGPGNVGRAILEAICFSAKANLAQIVAVAGAKPEQVLLCGGLTRIQLFNQIMASVLNRPVTVSQCKEASALGIAMASAVGAGIYPDLKTASEKMAGEFSLVEPVADWTEEYESSYEVWRENYDKFENEW